MAEVGKYTKAKKRGYKVAGLSAKQMEKATTLKGKKLTAGQKTKASKLTDISGTKWVKGKGVVGPKGKSFTGSVILPNGKTASYVKGRRIGINTKKATVAKPRSNGGGSSTGGKGVDKGKKTLTGPMIQAGVRNNYTHNAAMANKAGAEARRGNYPFPKNKRGIWLTPKSNARIEQILAQNRANTRKPSSRTVPKRLGN